MEYHGGPLRLSPQSQQGANMMTLTSRSAILAFAAFAILCMVSSCVAQQTPPSAADIQAEGVQIMADLEYGKVGDYSLRLDAFLPEEGGPHPVVVSIHGGGWRNGDKASFARQGVNFAKDGIAAFSVNYRLSDVAPYPAAVDDCVTAMRFLRSSAERFNIDPDRIAVIGGSAGGHLVLMMAFLEPAADELDSHGNPIKNRVVCCVAQNPPTDLTQVAGIEGGRPQSALSKFMGGTYAEKPDAYREASPVTYLSPDDPPVLLLHGTADKVVSYDQSVFLRDKMQQIGVPVELITIENAGHSLKNGDPEALKRAHDRMAEFLYQHIGVPIQH